LLPILWLSIQPAEGQVLRRGLGTEPDSLDIHQAQGLASLQVLRDTREGLLTFDAAGELVGGVAESWQAEDGGRSYRFRLRADARWSDGEPLVAEDFVRAWRAAVAPGSLARTAALLGQVRNAEAIMAGQAEAASLGITAESAHELRVDLASPAPWWLEILAHPVSYPQPTGGSGGARDGPSNGAYLLVESVPHSRILLERNSAYHDAGAVAVKQVEYLPIEDPGTELARYRAGELDITETIPPGRYEWLRQNLGGELRISPYLGSFWLGVNLKREPLGGSADLRRALSLAIDRETLVRVVLGAGEMPAWGVVPPGLDHYRAREPVAAELSRSEREDQARALYRSAGYGPDRPLRVEIRFNTSATHRRTAVAVAAMWKQVLGVNAELVHEEWKVFVNNRRLGLVTEVFRGGWIADYADPASFLELFRSGDPLNNTFYANHRYDLLLDQAAGLQGEPRMEALRQAESLLMRDTPVLPLYYYVSRHLVKARVQGYRDNVRDVHLSRYLSVETGPE